MIRKESKLAKCPYYRFENANLICCEGVEDGSSVHVVFGDVNKCREYKRKFCRSRYASCKVLQMLDTKYE